jgi:hypothetical protein
VVNQLLITVGSGIIESTWLVASIVTKFYLASLIPRIYIFEESLDEMVMDESRMVVGIYLLLGVILYSLGLSIDPIFPDILNEGIAVAYLGYLFWRF